jgi:hypothetical protein
MVLVSGRVNCGTGFLEKFIEARLMGFIKNVNRIISATIMPAISENSLKVNLRIIPVSSLPSVCQSKNLAI